MLEKQYKIVKDTPPMIEWDEYVRIIGTEYQILLDKYPNDERKFQEFFEEYPCMLPGAHGVHMQSGHMPFRCSVISQPKLLGLPTRIPDFLWFAKSSSGLYPIFIEIEAPGKKWFVGNGRKTTEHFNQAQNQLTEWKTWFSEPLNQQLFIKYYRIPQEILDRCSIHPYYVLIYGRRSEFKDKPHLNRRREQLQGIDEVYMTYDRLCPSSEMDWYLCSKVNDKGYYAISVPATFSLGPPVAKDYSIIQKKAEAISRNSHISKDRKKFLISRLDYWDTFGKNGAPGPWNLGDWE